MDAEDIHSELIANFADFPGQQLRPAEIAKVQKDRIEFVDDFDDLFQGGVRILLDSACDFGTVFLTQPFHQNPGQALAKLCFPMIAHSFSQCRCVFSIRDEE